MEASSSLPSCKESTTPPHDRGPQPLITVSASSSSSEPTSITTTAVPMTRVATTARTPTTSTESTMVAAAGDISALAIETASASSTEATGNVALTVTTVAVTGAESVERSNTLTATTTTTSQISVATAIDLVSSTSSPPKIIKKEYVNAMRVLLVIDQEARPVMGNVFHSGATGKKDSETLKEYLIRTKAMTNSKYKKTFNRTFREKIDHDPSCQSFDVSCWLDAIKFGCDGLASPLDDDVWLNSPDTLENHLKRIKDIRNDVMHSALEFSDRDFYRHVEEIRKLLLRTLKLAKIKYAIDSSRFNQIRADLNENINTIRDRPLVQLDLKSYESFPLFKALTKILESEGIDDLAKFIDKVSYVNPASMIVGYAFLLKVDIIYTPLVIVGQGRQQDDSEVTYMNLLSFAHQKKSADCVSSSIKIILIEGCAGSGKTTLVKMLLSDWNSGRTTGITKVQELNHYKFVILVECRDKNFSSLNRLIASLMPRARRSFQNEQHMNECLFHYPILLIIDGIDEMNSASKQICEEIFSVKNMENITIICTTRPQNLEDLFRMFPDDANVFHFRIDGVPENHQERFLHRYHEALKSEGISIQETEGLIKYFRNSSERLRRHWYLPFNLSLLALLWAVDSENVNHITTDIELLHHMNKLSTQKLLERLSKHELTKDFDRDVLQRKVDIIFSSICAEALRGLRDDNLYLAENSIESLQEKCRCLYLPPREIFGAFLMQRNFWSPKSIISYVSYPHKALQEHLGAQYVYDEIFVNINPVTDVVSLLRSIQMKLSDDELPPSMIDEIIDSTSRVLTQGSRDTSGKGKTILSTLEKINQETGKSVHLDKYIYLLKQLLGLFYINGRDKDEEIVQEVIDLLNKSSLTRYGWISILNDVKCTDTAAKLIVDIPGIMEGIGSVEDSNVLAVANLFKIKRPDIIRIKITGDPAKVPRMNEFLLSLAQHGGEVRVLDLSHLFRYPSDDSRLHHCLEQVMERCEVKRYRGQVTAQMPWKAFNHMKQFFVSVPDTRCSLPLRDFFVHGNHQLRSIGVSISKSVDPHFLLPFPDVSDGVEVIMPDLSDGDITRAVDILKKVSPVTGRKKLKNVSFPRCTFTPEGSFDLIKGMDNGGVTPRGVSLPNSCQSENLLVSHMTNNSKLQSIGWFPSDDRYLWKEDEFNQFKEDPREEDLNEYLYD